MPSTFTTNTGLEQPGDGEQAGLWGITANTNYDILDRALNGVVTVNLLSTSYTLTTSNGTLSEGQYAAILFTGTPGGTATVTIAPSTAQKTYLIRNATNQTLTITQGSGGNASIPAGRSAVVASTGTGAGATVFDITALVNTATSANTASTLVQRDASGNFSAGTITAALTGNATTATAATTATTATSAATWTTARTITIGSTGKSVDGSGNVSWNLSEIGAQASDATLTALAAYNTNGLLTQTGADTFTGRTLTAGTGTSVTDGDGVSGNPTVAVTTASTAEIQSLSGTNKLPTTAGIATAAALATPSGGADWTPDWSAFISATWVLTGDRTLSNPTNVIAGTTRVVRVASDSSTARTISYGANYKGSPATSVTNTNVALLTLYAVTSTEIVVASVGYTA
jgi:hypothetical protein